MGVHELLSTEKIHKMKQNGWIAVCIIAKGLEHQK